MTTLTDFAAQREIDKKILELEAAIGTLRTQRNAHSAISKLPPELIAEIFVEEQNLLRELFSSCFPIHVRDQSSVCRNLSLVCRHWRDIVLNTPRLWSTIDLIPPNRALEFIKRSKSAPLQVQCRTGPYDTAWLGRAAQAVMSHIGRVQELDLVAASPESLVEFLQLNKDAEAPLLEVLRLNSPPFVLPGDVFNRGMPCLRVLELTNGTLTSVLPYLPRLVELTVKSTPVDAGLTVTLLVQSLRNTPNLEAMSISALTSAHHRSTPTAPVALPRLSRLSVSSRDFGASNLFDLMVHPQSTTIVFDCRQLTHPIPGQDLSSLQRLCARFTVAGSSPIHQLTMAASVSFMISIKTACSASVPHLRISLPAEIPFQSYTQLCSSLPLSTIPDVCLEGFTNSWTQYGLLRSFKETRVLTLGSCTRQLILSLLKGRKSKQSPPFPNLHKMVMRECIFNHAYTLRDDEMFSAVKTFLAQRTHMKIGIRVLVIKGCDISREAVDDLRKLVEVEWDGVEIGDQDEDEYYSNDLDLHSDDIYAYFGM